MIILRAEEGNFLSNAYLVADEAAGKGVLVDSNGVTDPLVEYAERQGIEITEILLTHHHDDHVVGVEKLAERYGVPVYGHELCAEQVEAVTETIGDGDVVETGRAALRGDPHAGALRRPPGAEDQPIRLPDRRRALQGNLRRHRRPRGDRARRPA